MDQLDTLRQRVKKLHHCSVSYQPQAVLYIMSRDMRIQANHALAAAQQQALKDKLSLIVLFVGYDQRVGVRAREHIQFLCAGLHELVPVFKTLNISFVLRTGTPRMEWQRVIDEVRPAAVYFDSNPTRGSRQGQQQFAATARCPVYVVDAHNVVPVWLASPKQEVGARTLRPKIHHQLPVFLSEPLTIIKHPHSFTKKLTSLSPSELTSQLIKLYPKNNTDISRFASGETTAHAVLKDFINTRLKGYAALRNDPSRNQVSELSPYLHFGQLSSLTVALAVYDAVKHTSELQQDAETLIEEMIVRKELSDNFCYYNDHYDNLQGAPDWAQKTLAKHAADPREFVYNLEQFEAAATHDEAWNAAQLQLTRSGKIHGYMRMYWAKKVLEWSASPDEAMKTLIYLNDFYSVDGGDPNGYVGILWSVAGLHDRPWGERAVYGVVRSMVYNGLKRKFDIKSYQQQWS